jgi:hypothetical protein
MNKQQRDLIAALASSLKHGDQSLTEALEAAVAMFDTGYKTADGVLKHTGEEVFSVYVGPRGGMKVVPRVAVGSHAGDIWAVDGDGEAFEAEGHTRLSECYSTRERAEIAHHLANGPHDHDHLGDK